jgi:hypothetical protein
MPTTNTARTPPGTPQPAPRWVVWLAHAVPLCALPASLWRIGMIFGLVGVPGATSVGQALAIVALSLVTEGLALLTIGLVRPWGEVLPRWLPLVGGRPVRVWAAVTAASLGAAALTLLWSYALINYLLHYTPVLTSSGPPLPHTGWAGLGVQLCYSPLVAWGPLLAIVTVAYYLRRTRPNANHRSATEPVTDSTKPTAPTPADPPDNQETTMNPH